jgi:biotin carboxyl carrier protein
VLFILEVMKTEVPHSAGSDGTVTAVHITEGQEGVDAGTVAVEIG